LKAKLRLAASIAEIAALHSTSKSQKTSAAAADLLDRAPGAMAKLKAKGWEVKCLTVTEVFAVALRYFNTPLKKGLKDSAVQQLRTLIDALPGVLESITVEPALAAAPWAFPPSPPLQPLTPHLQLPPLLQPLTPHLQLLPPHPLLLLSVLATSMHSRGLLTAMTKRRKKRKTTTRRKMGRREKRRRKKKKKKRRRRGKKKKKTKAAGEGEGGRR
jgi:hypothetical protein